MITEFRDIISNTNNKHIKEYKDNGGKLIGYCCSFLPVGEVYDSVGMTAIRLRGNEASDTIIGDTYFGPVICSFPKCVLQMVGEGKYNMLDGGVISTGCDAMRRLDECWRKASTDIPGILPDFWYFFGIPHKTHDFNLKWYVDETRVHIKAVEDHFKVKITDKGLKKSIKKFNKARKLMKEFDKIRKSEAQPVSGPDAAAVLIAASSVPMDTYIELLEKYLKELKKKKEKTEGKRLLVIGSVADDPTLLETLEEVGGVIVADSNCFGSRFFENVIDEEGDPVEALARGYLDRVKCPRMFGVYKERLTHYKNIIEESKIDGVILQNIRFCDLHGSENGVLEKDLEEMGIPCIKMEREYGTLVETGRIRMRMEAFMERIN